MKERLIQTALHALELAVVVMVAYLATKLFRIEGEGLQVLLAVVLGAIAKFARTSEVLPDWVNK